MKLKTKFQDEDFRLGEICEASITTDRGGVIKVGAPANDGGWHEFYYESLKDMLDKWEDYEEPKETASRWMILTLENFIENEPDDRWIDLEDCKQMLEKLKAWKRLKDKGLKIRAKIDQDSCGEQYAWLKVNWGVLDGDLTDVFICFGGEK